MYGRLEGVSDSCWHINALYRLVSGQRLKIDNKILTNTHLLHQVGLNRPFWRSGGDRKDLFLGDDQPLPLPPQIPQIPAAMFFFFF